MLKMLHGKAKDEQWNNQIKEKLSPSLQEEIPFQDAAWPLPFVPGLEYNSPAHGTWNIVHMGMLLPGSHQIYGGKSPELFHIYEDPVYPADPVPECHHVSALSAYYRQEK